MDLPFTSTYQICATLPSFLITTLQTSVHSQRLSLKTDGTREQECRLGSQTLDGHGRTASYLSTWTYPSPQLIRYAPHFPVSSSQRFKLLYILRDYAGKGMVPVNKSVGWVARRSMDTSNCIILKHMDLPFTSTYQICATLPSFLITTLQTSVHSQKISLKTRWYV